MLYAIITCSALLFAAPEDEFIVDDFYFSWSVAQVGDIELEITKTENGTGISFSDDGIDSYLEMTPNAAVKIGKLLSRTDEFYKKFGKLKGEQRERFEIEDFVVSFAKTDSFFVSISEGEIAETTIILGRKEADIFSRHMLKADRMVKFIDGKIDP